MGVRNAATAFDRTTEQIEPEKTIREQRELVLAALRRALETLEAIDKAGPPGSAGAVAQPAPKP